MATHHTTPLTALAIAARLVKANIPFILTVVSQHRADIECKFEETLGTAVMQQYREEGRTPTGRLVKPFEPELHRLPITGSMEYPQLQQIPRYVPDASDLNEMNGEDQH